MGDDDLHVEETGTGVGEHDPGNALCPRGHRESDVEHPCGEGAEGGCLEVAVRHQLGRRLVRPREEDDAPRVLVAGRAGRGGVGGRLCEISA